MAAVKSSHLHIHSEQVRVHPPHIPEDDDPSAFNIPQLGRDAAGTAEYIASMTTELAQIAGLAKLDMLTYFLNMARLEAEFHMRRRK